MNYREFKQAMNVYFDLADGLTHEELVGFLAFIEEELQKIASPNEIEKFNREFKFFIAKWSDKYPEEMRAIAERVQTLESK